MADQDDERADRAPQDPAAPRRTSSRGGASGAARPLPPRSGGRAASTNGATPTVPPTFSPEQGRRPRPSADAAPPMVVGRTPVPPPVTARPPAPRPATPRPPTGPRPPSSDRPAAPRPAAAPPSVLARSGPPGAAPASTPGGSGTRVRRVALIGLLLLALLLTWPVGLALWANGRIEHVPARSDATGTPGTTYLLAGSDSREDGVVVDTETLGARTDTIMVLQVPRSGPAALISLPRDTFVDIPGHGPAKLNAAFSLGGPSLLVQTVEALTGLTVDHYVEVGFGGVEGVVDAVGGVELCLDYDVNEPLSGLVWTAGCAVANGPTALAFARMRHADPQGDIGRTQRQQQLIGAITSEVAQPSLLGSPGRQVGLVRAGTDALAVSDGTSIVDLARLALAFRAAGGPGGITGTPPIANPDYRPGDIGSTVLLDPDLSPAFWAAIAEGSLAPGAVGGLPTG